MAISPRSRTRTGFLAFRSRSRISVARRAAPPTEGSSEGPRPTSVYANGSTCPCRSLVWSKVRSSFSCARAGVVSSASRETNATRTAGERPRRDCRTSSHWDQLVAGRRCRRAWMPAHRERSLRSICRVHGPHDGVSDELHRATFNPGVVAEAGDPPRRTRRAPRDRQGRLSGRERALADAPSVPTRRDTRRLPCGSSL